MIRSNEFFDVFTPIYLDQIITKISDIIQESNNHEKTDDIYGRKFGTILIELGLKLKYEEYIKKGESLLSNLSPQRQSEAYIDVGEFCLKNKDFDVKKKAKPYLIKAYEKWDRKKRVQNASSMAKLVRFLKEERLIKQYQNGRDYFLDFTKQRPKAFHSSILLTLAEKLVGLENEKKIKSILKIADKIVTYQKSFEVIAERAEITEHTLSRISKRDPFLDGKTLFELQLAIAKASKNYSTLDKLVKEIERNALSPMFAVIPKTFIARTLYEIGEKTKSLNLFQELISFLLSKGDNVREKSPSEIWYATYCAVQLANVCISIDEYDLAKKLIPILTQKTGDSGLPHVPGRKLLLFDLEGGITESREELLKEVETIKHKDHIKRVTESYEDSETVSEPQILEAFNNGDIKKLEVLLQKYEMNMIQTLKSYQEQEPQYPKPILASLAYYIELRNELTRISSLIEFSEILLKVGRTTRAEALLKEIDESFNQTQPIKQSTRSSQRGYIEEFQYYIEYTRKDLYRKYLSLKMRIGCSEEELNDLIEYSLQYDSEVAPVIGIILAERGELTQAQEILDELILPLRDNLEWFYSPSRLKIFRKIGDYEEVFKYRNELYNLVPESGFKEILFLGEEDRIKEVIDKGLFDAFAQTLLRDEPPSGVTKKIWVYARSLFAEKLEVLASNFELGPLSGRQSLQTLLELCEHLIQLNSTNVVREKALQLVSTLQDGINVYVSPKIKQKIARIDAGVNSWDFKPLMYQALDRGDLIPNLVTIDLWNYYKENNDLYSLKEMHAKFNTTYKRWRDEAWSGDKANQFTYFSIPLVYEFLVEILEKIGDEENASICRNNLAYIKEIRFQHVINEPLERGLDPKWHSGIFRKLYLEIKTGMVTGDLPKAKKRFDQALDLLDHPDINKFHYHQMHIIYDMINMLGCLASPQGGHFARMSILD